MRTVVSRKTVRFPQIFPALKILAQTVPGRDAVNPFICGYVQEVTEFGYAIYSYTGERGEGEFGRSYIQGGQTIAGGQIDCGVVEDEYADRFIAGMLKKVLDLIERLRYHYHTDRSQSFRKR
ncbi:MAG: hypothetical protein R2824_30925 [Saprospiraceae bacterium]